MWIELATDVSILDLPVNQRFPLVQGIPLLEEINQELLATQQKATIDYFIYYDRDQEVPVLEASLLLPIENQSIVDAIQAPVEEMTSISEADKDAFLSLFQKGLPKNKKPPALKAKKKTSGTKGTPKKTPSILRLPPFLRDKRVMILIGLVLLLVGVAVVGSPLLRQENQGTFEEQCSIQSLKKEVNEVHVQLDAQDKLHTFNRFFLTNYYSGTNAPEKNKQKVKPFVSPEVEKKFSPSGSQVKSISPWTLKKTKSGWEATYVVSVQTKEKAVETNRVQFTVQEKEKNYQVTTLPKEEPFDLTKKTNE